MKTCSAIGDSLPIRDAELKVTGRKQYVGDMRVPGMLHAALLCSPLPHARIKSISTDRARALPGVRDVVTYREDPGVLFNSATRFYEHQIPNTERIFDSTVRYVGDRVAAVAADTPEIAQKALELIDVDYEPLPFYTDVEAAAREGAYPIHGESNVITTMVHNAGDLEAGFAQADRIFEDRYSTPPIHHGAIERHVAIADYDYTGKLTIISPNQNVFGYRIILSRIFGLPMSRVRVSSPAIGGSFGGKLEMTIEPVAALLSMRTGRPVRLELSRKQCINATRTRHGSVVYLRTGVKNDGTLVAQDIRIMTNTGAYAGSCMNVLGALSHKVFKMYKCPNIRFTGQPVYTNTPVGGAMRGYGSPQAFFGQQRQLQKIAKALQISLAELQLKNLVGPDALDPIGFYSLGNPRPLDCLRRGLELAENWGPLDDEGGKYAIGAGLAMGAHGNGCFGAHRDQICLMIKMNEDGTCVLYTGSHDMGNGSVTAQTQIISSILHIPTGWITVVEADSDACPWNLGDYASHGIYVAGSAAKKAAEAVARELQKEAAALLGEPEEGLTLEEGGVRSAATGELTPLDQVMIHAQNVSHREIICQETYAMPAGPTSYGAHLARVRVEKATGKVAVTDYVAVHDVGKVVNRMSIEGQLHGGIHMGMGYALCEGLSFDEEGRSCNDSFVTNPILRSHQMPRIQVDFIEETEPTGPFGAKSIGEAAVVPAAPAVINAIENALGVEINDLPYRFGGGAPAPREKEET
jgi:CO/xanthine dehydrogenase Mo-binding subunit